ncbi:hypothetical protein [Streptomyces sp. NPDC060131]|uniref:hypothetical protein n=1 Tax=unclassified Streptomyces TaxID=2593676 RepID=UPI00364910DC
MRVALLGDPLRDLVYGFRDWLVGGVDPLSAPSGGIGLPARPTVPSHRGPAVVDDDVGPVMEVEGVLPVPCGPAEEGVDCRSIPPAGVSLGESSAPDRVGDINQAHGDAVQQWRGGHSEDFTQGRLPAEQEVNAAILVLHRASHPHLGRPMSPVQICARRHPELIGVVHDDLPEPAPRR